MIAVDPANAKELTKLGRAYRRLKEAHGEQRATFRDKEGKAVTKFMDALKVADISPHSDGSYRFTCDGYLITIPAVKNPPIKMKPLKEGAEPEDDDDDDDSDE